MRKSKLFDSLLVLLVVITIAVTSFAVYVVAVNNAPRSGTAEDTWPTYVPTFSDTSYNDISIPLADFPAYTGEDGTMHIPAKSHFKNGEACRYYGGTRQCDGFALFALDSFWHMVDTSRQYPSWRSSGGVNNADYHSVDKTTDSRSEEQWIEFFNDLSIGTLVRYGSLKDLTPADGKHTILFMGVDEDGYILAYECNQDAYVLGATATDHCGVDYQRYSIEKINERYDFVLYYVEHEPESPILENKTYHKAGCANCAGYLRQRHSVTAQKTWYNDQQHKLTYGCCSGHTMENHAVPTVQQYNSVKHKKIYSCCGVVYENHVFTQQGSSPGAAMECQVCNYSVLLNNTGLELETE